MKIVYCLFFAFLSGLYSVSGQTDFHQTAQIATFTRIWGFLKYYHPQVAKGKTNWDKEFTSRLNTVIAFSSKEEVSAYYLNWINSLGKVKACKKCKNDYPDSLKMNLDLDWLSDTSVFSAALSERLNYIRENRNQGKNYYVQQSRWVGNTSYKHEKIYPDSVFPSAELRLLGLARYWNIINYFFPYKYRTDKNWNEVLTSMIPKFRDAADTLQYHLAMLELTASLNDTHAGFNSRYTSRFFFGTKTVPFGYLIIDNKVVVNAIYNDSLCQLSGILFGDVITTVDGKPVEDLIMEKAPYMRASNPSALRRNLSMSLLNGETDSVTLTLERKGVAVEKRISRYSYKQLNFKWSVKQNPVCEILPDSIGYVNMGVLERGQVDSVFKVLAHTRALIFDVRNYPKGTFYRIGSYLNKEKRDFAMFTEPLLSYPGMFTYTAPVHIGKENPDYYKGKVIVLMNAYSQSHAEFTVMGLQTAPDVLVIGSQTAGADGNVSTIVFPGGFKTHMTGIGVFYPDGRETQRIGIVPDIEVLPSIPGVQAGRDEVLEKALEIIRQGN